MTQLFEIKEVEGKGLGWVATKNIKRGTVIFTEKPQLALNCCSEKQMESGNRVMSSIIIEKYLHTVDLAKLRSFIYFPFFNFQNLLDLTKKKKIPQICITT